MDLCVTYRREGGALGHGRTQSEEWRLHFWHKGPRVVIGMPAFIHTHNCHVESRILKGQITKSYTT